MVKSLDSVHFGRLRGDLKHPALAHKIRGVEIVALIWDRDTFWTNIWNFVSPCGFHLKHRITRVRTIQIDQNDQRELKRDGYNLFQRHPAVFSLENIDFGFERATV